MPGETTVDAYLDALASRSATPGGGAVAGITGAQGAALLCMVCNLTKSDVDEIAAINQRASVAAHAFRQLASDDSERFNAVMAAYKLPKASRESQLQPALKAAAAVPLEVMRLAASLVPDSARLLKIGNPNLLTDTGIGALLLGTTMQAARLNVLVNLDAISDDAFNRSSHAEIKSLAAATSEATAVFEATLSRFDK